MLAHSETLNPYKCGSKNKPDLDSDDMIPCWAVQCYDCKQFVHGPNWKIDEAVNRWNNANPIMAKTDIIPCICLTCGVRNDFSNPTGLCKNNHDDWLEYRDVFMEEDAEPEPLKRACKLTGLSVKKFRKLFIDTTITQLSFKNDR